MAILKSSKLSGSKSEYDFTIYVGKILDFKKKYFFILHTGLLAVRIINVDVVSGKIFEFSLPEFFGAAGDCRDADTQVFRDFGLRDAFFELSYNFESFGKFFKFCRGQKSGQKILHFGFGFNI